MSIFKRSIKCKFFPRIVPIYWQELRRKQFKCVFLVKIVLKDVNYIKCEQLNVDKYIETSDKSRKFSILWRKHNFSMSDEPPRGLPGVS